VDNVARVFKELPRSPVRTALLHELTDQLPVTKSAEALGVSHSAVSRASEYCDRPFVEFLRQLGFPRANRADSHAFLERWLANPLNCPVPSGWNTRCFTGSRDLMWAEYASASLANAIAPLHEATFHAVREREHVGIRSGDIFINRDEVELAELQALIKREPAALTKEVKERMAILECNLRFCKERKRYYRQAHQDLKGNSKKMVVTVDFTGAQTGMSDKFHNFVVVVCTDLPLQVPEGLAAALANPVTPQMKKHVEKPNVAKKKRKTKKEIEKSGGGRKLLSSWSQAKVKIAKERKLPGLEVAGGEDYKPCCTAFHFVLRRDDSTPGQTSPYVQWTMDLLFQKHNLAAGFDEIHLFSDGCGKHFKTYPTHWYVFMSHYLSLLLLLGILLIFSSICERGGKLLPTTPTARVEGSRLN